MSRPPRRPRQLAAGVLTLLLVAVVTAGLVRGGGANAAPADRAGRLAARLRCPVCQSVSVADSPSETARAMRAQVERMMAEGRSDQQIIDWFQARYGPWILLDPPASGRTLPLWLLPGAGLMVGGLLLAGCRRRPPGRPLTPEARARVAEELAKQRPRAPSATDGEDEPSEASLGMPEARRDQATRDLLQLDRQVQAGEIQPGAAARLRVVYEADLAQALAALDAADQQPPAGAAQRADRAGRRRLAGGALVAAVALAVAVLLPRAVVTRPPGGFVSGVEAAGAEGPPAADSPAVTDAQLQAAVDANPDVVAMRLLLAGRYFAEGRSDQALAQYTEVLKRQRDPQALSHAGWLLAQAGRAQAGARLVEESLAARPDQPDALWFLANVRLFGLHDPKRAVGPLQRLLARPDLRGDARSQVERLLATARRQARPATP